MTARFWGSFCWRIYKIYCRDNQGGAGIISRELVKETLGADTNNEKRRVDIPIN